MVTLAAVTPTTPTTTIMMTATVDRPAATTPTLQRMPTRHHSSRLICILS
jgi:hypothetical protein